MDDVVAHGDIEDDVGFEYTPAGGRASTAAKATPKAKAKATAAGKGGDGAGKASLAATKWRSKTLKEFSAIRLGQVGALEAADRVLAEAQKEMGAETAQSDASLELIKLRRRLVEMMSDTRQQGGPSADDMWDLVTQDAFLKEQLSPADLQTYGQMLNVRNVEVKVQATAEAVDRLMEHQKDAFLAAKTCTQALQLG